MLSGKILRSHNGTDKLKLPDGQLCSTPQPLVSFVMRTYPRRFLACKLFILRQSLDLFEIFVPAFLLDIRPIPPLLWLDANYYQFFSESEPCFSSLGLARARPQRLVDSSMFRFSLISADGTSLQRSIIPVSPGGIRIHSKNHSLRSPSGASHRSDIPMQPSPFNFESGLRI